MVSGDPRIGTQLGPYRIERELGRGGMGIVYLAQHVHLERAVALKVLSDALASDAAFRQRFVRESRLAARLRHPNIIPVYDAGEQDGVLFIAMQFVEGTDLSDLLARGPLPPAEAVRILELVASALDEAHASGMVHRDVKPANIVLGPERHGADREVYLTDFGLVRELDPRSRLTKTGSFVGTLAYAPPEMFRNVQIDGRSDQYSLGCVLYECLTGDVPFPRDSEGAMIGAHLTEPPPRPSVTRPGLPAGFDAVLARAMAKEPSERFESCGDMMRAARAALEGAHRPAWADSPTVVSGGKAAPEGPAAPPPPVPMGAPPAGPTGGRRRGWLIGVIAALVAVAFVVGILVTSGGGSPGPGPGGTSAAGTSPPAGTSAPPTTPPTTPPGTSAPPTTGPTGSPVAPGARPVVEDTVKVGGLPFGVARDATSVWVANQGSGTVSRVDPDTHRVTTRNDVPNAFEIAAGLGSVWVTDQRQTLYRLDPAGGSPQAIHMQGGAFGVTLGFGSVWVTNDKGNTVTRLDPSGKVLGRIPTGNTPHGIAAGTDSVWVANESGTVTRIDPETGTRSAQISLNGDEAFQLAEASGSVWVTNGISKLIKIDPARNEVADVVNVSGGSFDVIGGFGSVWLSKAGNNTLVRIDPDTDAEADSLEVGSSPRLIAVGPEGLWVASGDTRQVYLVHP